MLYTFPVEPEQAVVAPVIEPGVAGAVFIVTALLLAELVPQLLVAVTLTLPEVAPKVTVALVVPCPAVTVAPAGTVHV